MKVWILYDTKFGNGKKLSEFLAEQFPKEDDINTGDVKKIAAKSVAQDNPNILILGGAVRMFRGGLASKKWLKELNKELKKANNEILYATAFLTHGLPTDKIQNFGKRFLKKIEKASQIKKTYSPILTAQVKDQEGPILPDEMEKAEVYIKNFIKWIHG